MLIPIRYNLRSLVVRRATTLATALGISLVVWVLASAMMLAEGVRRTLGSAGRADVAIVLRNGSDAELGSTVEEQQVGLVLAMPGVRREGGQPIGAGETVVIIAAEKVGSAGVSNLQLRGITETGEKLRPTVKLQDGRRPTPGADEAMIGSKIRGRFKGIELGQRFDIKKNRPIAIVGVFEDGGSAHESEVWVDGDIVRSSFGRGATVSSVRVKLDALESFDTFKTHVEQDKRLGLLAMRETDYYEKASEGTGKFIRILGTLIAMCFALGAMIGASNTMYASVANRRREIGVLRALGFSRIGILISFLFESVLLALLGGVIGVVAALGTGSLKFSVLNQSTWSEMVFSFQPTPSIILGSLVAAAVVGILGGFLPAVRAARVSPLEALRG